MQLLMVRHALPERSATTADPGLADLGRHQASALCDALEGHRIARIFVSPQRRARETAEPLRIRRALTPDVEHMLAEYDVDHHHYIPFHEAERADADTYDRIRAGLLPNYVDETAFRGRVLDGIRAVVDRADHEDTVAVVTHGGVINVLLQHLLALAKPMTFPLEYVSVSRVLVSRNGTMKVASINETAHTTGLLPDRTA